MTQASEYEVQGDTSSDHLESMAQTLEATGDYRVIRRLNPRPSNMPSPETPVRLGMVVDV